MVANSVPRIGSTRGSIESHIFLNPNELVVEIIETAKGFKGVIRSGKKIIRTRPHKSKFWVINWISAYLKVIVLAIPRLGVNSQAGTLDMKMVDKIISRIKSGENKVSLKSE